MEINVKESVKSNLINKSELARQLWPKNKYGVQYLNKKINKTNGKRITEKDEVKIKQIIEKQLCITY